MFLYVQPSSGCLSLRTFLRHFPDCLLHHNSYMASIFFPTPLPSSSFFALAPSGRYFDQVFVATNFPCVCYRVTSTYACVHLLMAIIEILITYILPMHLSSLRLLLLLSSVIQQSRDGEYAYKSITIMATQVIFFDTSYCSMVYNFFSFWKNTTVLQIDSKSLSRYGYCKFGLCKKIG